VVKSQYGIAMYGIGIRNIACQTTDMMMFVSLISSHRIYHIGDFNGQQGHLLLRYYESPNPLSKTLEKSKSDQ